LFASGRQNTLVEEQLFMNDEQKTDDDSSAQPSHSNDKKMGEEHKEYQLEEELKECKDKYLRTLAEMENTRKRMLKEKQESTRFAVENILAELLPPLDNLENALGFVQNMSEETRKWATGFQMILAQFKDVLNNHGVAAFQSVGTLFDPHKHQAVEIEETKEKPEGMILQEFVKGYKCGERTIRPARVKVAKAPSLQKEEKATQFEETNPGST
jgi:molecular chaperone GrpE